MAEGYGVRTVCIMRDSNFISDNGLDDFDTASQGSRDECVERDPGFVEDRFRVDRRKLEQMLQLGKWFCERLLIRLLFPTKPHVIRDMCTVGFSFTDLAIVFFF